MITQLEIDGFKTFKNFKVELAPFQVIVGPNGAGKSNLFDALRLLSRLVDEDLRSAFLGLRGDVNEQFTTYPNGSSSKYIDIKVEMLVDRKITDSYGEQAELKYTRLRYELKLMYDPHRTGLNRLYIANETLRGIAPSKDKWVKKYIGALERRWLPAPGPGQSQFIETSLAKGGTSVIALCRDTLNRDTDFYTSKRFPAEKAERTVLSGVTTIEYPHAFAARQELLSWRFLNLLNPRVLREPGSVIAPTSLSEDGKNFATMLARICEEDPLALRDISLDMASLVPGLLHISVKKDQERNEYVVQAEGDDGSTFSARVLSDGTLRLLALTALCNDPAFHGVIGIEEPENGVHPFQLKHIACLLSETATNFQDEEQANEPLRQVLVTTHSPVFISQPEVVNSLLFAFTATDMEPGASSLRTTRIVPVTKSDIPSEAGSTGKAERHYSIHQVLKYLDTDSFHSAQATLVRED